MENCVRGRAGGRVGQEAASLPLPPPPRMAAANSSAAAASIRAHLARTASGVDAQPSPRSLLSRILLRGGGDGGSGGGGFGCRVRLPRRYGGGMREERKDGSVSEQGETPRVKVVEPPPLPELPLETPRSSLGRKKPEEELVSMNLGLGASLVLLLSRSAVELNKMVELRAQMEALVLEIRHAAQWKENANHPAASTSRESNGSSATTANVKDPIAFPAVDADAASNCSRTTADNAVSGRAAAVVIDQLEAELQAELGRMQRGTDRTALGGGDADERMIAPMQGLEVKTKAGNNAIGRASRSRVGGGGAKDDGEVVDGNAEEEEEEEDDEEAEEEEEEGGYDEDRSSPPHAGVSARALERRLHELLQKRQQDRIVELESALDAAQRRLHEKEREVVWWRDAAKLVSHRRDESRRDESRRFVR
ncbi:protein POLAR LOCALIZATION DURING ASYMMETRIC DIVISION AND REDISTRIBUTION-like isoform X2 [Panicum virgatum]|uniref:protein POLAR LOCALIZATION DURING ASYMMETRIC DIVISION AND REDISTRIBUTION-like isoform X2 n=1 Tax=Panicum virgatum TaxID=38727 RepID=UPI0019D4FFA7|nr:protein POLAR LOCALIZATION DURING ASYMMETRIC DIVISION AND REDISTRIBUTION-like isoform X2 [Panicum virgatum]